MPVSTDRLAVINIQIYYKLYALKTQRKSYIDFPVSLTAASKGMLQMMRGECIIQKNIKEK